MRAAATASLVLSVTFASLPVPLLADVPQAIVDLQEHDFGVCNGGQPLFHSFVVWNAGTADLRIADVRTSCGCTVAESWERLVPPGAMWDLPITFEPYGRVGPQKQIIEVVTNDPDKPVITFTLKAFVAPPLRVTPANGFLGFGLVEPRDNTAGGRRLAAEIAVDTDESVRFGAVRVEPPIFHVCFERVAEGAAVGTAASQSAGGADSGRPPRRGDIYELELALAGALPEGPHTATVTLDTGVPDQPRIRLLAELVIAPRVTVLPQATRIPPQRTSPLRRPLILENRCDEPMEVSTVDVACPGVRSTVETLAPGRKYRVWLTIMPDAEIPAAGCAVRVRTALMAKGGRLPYDVNTLVLEGQAHGTYPASDGAP